MESEGSPTSVSDIECSDADDYDSPWKEAIERHFPDFLRFFFPTAHAQIDWSQPFVFLDQELRSVVRDAEAGNRQVDKLVRVTCHGGQSDWIFIHLEVQGEDQPKFAERMFVYHYRLYDRYHHPIASMALLADQRSNWQPDHFGYEALGCRLSFQYPVAKLMDWVGSEARLEDTDNPFALVTQAHLATRATRHDIEARKIAKWKMVQSLYRRGYDRQMLLDLYAILDWMLWLPQKAQASFRERLSTYEEELSMRYVTTNERMAKAEGIQLGKIQALELLLKKRFGEIPGWASEKLASADLPKIENWTCAVLSATSIEDALDEENRH
jgi:hypothetical protein